VLTITSGRAVDAQSAQGAVRVHHARGPARATPIRVTKRNRIVEIRTDGLEPGAYVVAIGELLDVKGGRLVDPITVSVIVGALAGKVPPALRVEHAVHLSVGELAATRLVPGAHAVEGEQYLELVKAVHRETGEAESLAFGAGGERVDADEILQGVEKRRLARFGTIHETLWRHLETVADDDPVDVVIWPRIEDHAAYDKPSDRRVDQPHPAQLEHDAVVRKARARLTRLVKQHATDVSDPLDDRVPLVRATVPASRVREIASSAAVGAVFLDDRTAINDLGDSIAVARSDRAHNLGFDGTGVRVAVFEDGPSNTTNLVLAGRYQTSPPASNHARLTHAIVKNDERGLPHGHAPDCELYSANSQDNDALRWAANQGCTVISQSFHRSSEPGGSGLQGDDVLKDWLVLRWPYPTIVQAAGNYWQGDPDNIQPPESEYVNHKGYNSLAIGNHNDDASAMSGDSVFRNPTSTHGDRELPELAANGTSVSANWQTMSGTSFAAPAAAGVAALLQDVDPVLCSWPEG
ncbi:MAG: S8 family serine peptidase, partial [Jatrophihabitantaceae bacterium]